LANLPPEIAQGPDGRAEPLGCFSFHLMLHAGLSGYLLKNRIRGPGLDRVTPAIQFLKPLEILALVQQLTILPETAFKISSLLRIQPIVAVIGN
jgi:hypothetical protein